MKKSINFFRHYNNTIKKPFHSFIERAFLHFFLQKYKLYKKVYTHIVFYMLINIVKK